MEKIKFSSDNEVTSCIQNSNNGKNFLLFKICAPNEEIAINQLNLLFDRLEEMDNEFSKNGNYESFGKLENIKYNEPIEAYIITSTPDPFFINFINKALNRPLHEYVSARKIDFRNKKLSENVSLEKFLDISGFKKFNLEIFAECKL